MSVGSHWEYDRPSYLANAPATSIIFQPPTFDDDTYKRKRIWIPLRKQTRDDSIEATRAMRRCA